MRKSAVVLTVCALLVFGFSTVQAKPSGSENGEYSYSVLAAKIDPLLQSPTHSSLVRFPGLEKGIHSVTIQTYKGIDPSLLSMDGIVIRSTVGEISTAFVREDRLVELAASPGVKFIFGDRPLQPSLDMSVPDARADWLWSKTASGSELTGEGVIFALIDTGIDWTHVDFISESGDTRIAYIWDQSLDPEAGEHHPQDPFIPGLDLFTYGVEYDAMDIQIELDDGPPWHDTGVRHRDTHAHGTHVAGNAAGDGSGASGSYTGIAPSTDIMVVANSLAADPSQFVQWETTVIDGLSYIQTKTAAMGKPVVVNLSFGHHFRSHDGNDPISVVIDTVSRPGFIVVTGAGNDGEKAIHASGAATYAPLIPGVQHFDMAFGDMNSLQGIYYDIGAMSITVTTSPDIHGVRRTCGPLMPGDPANELTCAFQGDWHIWFEGPPIVDADIEFEVTLTNGLYLSQGLANKISIHGQRIVGAGLPQGDWFYDVTPQTATTNPYEYDSWIAYSAVGSDLVETVYVTPDLTKTMSDPASSVQAIAVGAYVTKPRDSRDTIADIATFSSRGPTRDERQKPEVVAPGRKIYAPQSKDYTYPEDDDPLYEYMSGTSMASPHVAGTVALMLQVDPLLIPTEVKSHILAYSTKDVYTPSGWDDLWGNGKLNSELYAARLDVTDPVITSFQIDGGAPVTNDRTVELDLQVDPSLLDIFQTRYSQSHTIQETTVEGPWAPELEQVWFNGETIQPLEPWPGEDTYPDNYNECWIVSDIQSHLNHCFQTGRKISRTAETEIQLHFDYLDLAPPFNPHDHFFVSTYFHDPHEATLFYGELHENDMWVIVPGHEARLGLQTDNKYTDKGFKFDRYKYDRILYPKNYYETWRFEEQGAKGITVHFSEIDLGAGDYLTVSDDVNGELARWTNTQQTNQFVTSPEPRVFVKMFTDQDESRGKGFVIDWYSYLDYEWDVDWADHDPLTQFELTGHEGIKTIWTEVIDHGENIALTSDTIELILYPEPITNLFARFPEGGGTDDIVLSWDPSPDDPIYPDGEGDVTVYLIYRSTELHGTYVCIDLVGPGSPNPTWTNHGAGLTSDNYFYAVGAYDDDFLTTVDPKERAGKFVISLDYEKDLISIPLKPWDTYIPEVLRSIEGKYSVIWYWNAIEKDWKKYKPQGGSEFWNIDETMGFWIVMTDYPADLVSVGKVNELTSIPLYNDFNLIGFPSLEDGLTAYDAFYQYEDIDRVEGFDPGCPPVYLRVLDPTDPVSAGNGYWVRSTAEDVWYLTFENNLEGDTFP